MNRVGSFHSGVAFALAAVLTLGCATVALPSPTDAPTDAVPTSTPTPSRPPTAPPTAAPTPTIGPTNPPEPARSAEEIVTLLVAFSVSDETFELAMDGTVDGTVGAQATSVNVGVSGDGIGQDFVGTTLLSGPGVTLSFEMVVIGDTVWVQPTGGDWTQGPRDESQPIQPLFELKTEDVTYGGITDLNGEIGHRVTINRWTGGDLRSNGYRRVRISIIKYEVLVNNDGNPVEIELDYHVDARIARQVLDADYFLHYLLSDFGKAVVIDAPL
jgi:hypothetical protein